ncbi:MAG: hypothetical protein OXP75_20105 [Rhodospirillales bacterium]|nr:hypothetical protein [Rhodospirillales bacterium]
MAARKDDGQEPPASGRPGVIWRLPATQGAPESTDAPDAPNTSEAGADRPRGRRAPLLAAIGLAVALVCVGLYAAWSEFGSDIFGTGGEQTVASAPASTPPVAERTGDGPSGGGTATSPPADGTSAPLAVAEVEKDDAESGPAEGAPSVVTAPQNNKTAPRETAAPEPAAPAADPPSSSPTLGSDDPPATPVVASAHVEEQAVPARATEVAAEASSFAADEPRPATRSTAQADLGADALGALNARLEALETESAGAIGAGTAVIALEQRVRALEEDPTREPLGEALAAWGEQRAALEAALVEVGARLAHFEENAAQQAAADGRLVTLVLATGELTAALGSSLSFAPALDAVRGIAGDDPAFESALARLAPFAATGVPTTDGLLARFPEAANAIVRAAPTTEDADWIDETVTRLSQLVTIRKTGGAIDPQSLDGRLVEAESALVAGDLGRAIAIVEALVPGAAEAASAQAWLRDARARREADDARAALVATVHARIGARWAVPGTPP